MKTSYQATAVYSEDNFKYPVSMKKKILKLSINISMSSKKYIAFALKNE